MLQTDSLPILIQQLQFSNDWTYLTFQAPNSWMIFDNNCSNHDDSTSVLMQGSRKCNLCDLCCGMYMISIMSNIFYHTVSKTVVTRPKKKIH
jgi:hypothetical protein